VLQAITIEDRVFESYASGTDFIQRYIFPGGCLPSPAAMAGEVARAGLAEVGHQAFGASYARTLAEWRRRFQAAWPQIAPLGFDDAFRRIWEFYLCYCEAGFRAGTTDVGLFALQHGSRLRT
jgi:cyclopropane-fatty-acyl-phospholipid synthase